MKTLTWWKVVNLMPGVDFEISLKRSITSDTFFFEDILIAVRKSNMSFTLTKQEDVILESRTPL